jgi:hypothetical protein
MGNAVTDFSLLDNELTTQRYEIKNIHNNSIFIISNGSNKY